MSKYFITPNFPDFNALTLNDDFEVMSTFYLHNSTVSPDLGLGKDYSFVSSLGLKDNTVYWVLTFDDFTNFHYVFIDLFDSMLDPSENLSVLNGVSQKITFIYDNIFFGLPDFNYSFGGNIVVYREQIFLPYLYFGGNHFSINCFDAPLFCGLIDSRSFTFVDFSKMIFEKASSYGLEFVGLDGVTENTSLTLQPSFFESLASNLESVIHSRAQDLKEEIQHVQRYIYNLNDAMNNRFDNLGSVVGVVDLDGETVPLSEYLSGSNGFGGVYARLDGLGSIGSGDSLTLNQSLNGADGSYADGTEVTVTNRDGVFKVLYSRNYYNDAKESQNMIFYLLERTDLEHKPTMFVADIYVKKVVIP